MTEAVNRSPDHRQEWIKRVRALADQIRGWSRSQGWDVQEDQKTVSEPSLGSYPVPVLRIDTPAGTLHLTPIALHVLGANGRVDLEAIPTLSRVKLVGWNGGWRVMTDSNVPLRDPWNEQTFVQLVGDLLS